MGENREDNSNLLGKTDNTATLNGTLDIPTEDTSLKRILANESLSMLREKWFNSYKFSASTQISDIKYKHLR